MEYPRQMYHPDGRSMPVNSQQEESAIGSDWSREPADIHRQPQLRTAPEAVSLPSSTGNPIGDDFVDKVIARMREEFPALSASPAEVSSEPPRRGPGRPPRNPANEE